jgi:TrmH family RNA methyltransferase
LVGGTFLDKLQPDKIAKTNSKANNRKFERNCMNTKVTNIHLEKLSQQKIKFIKSLQLKKNRDAQQCLYLEGETLIKELLRYFSELIDMLVIEQHYEYDWQIPNIPTFLASSNDLEKITQLKTAKKLNAVVRYPHSKPWDESGLVLLLDEIQDPGNLGSIIRTADWYGIRHIFCSPNTVDFLNPKVIHSTMISAFRVQLHYQDLMPLIQKYQSVTYGALMTGKPFEEVEAANVKLIVLGNEGRGISPELTSLLTHKITIPRVGAAESLNVGVAAGILLQHFTK